MYPYIYISEMKEVSDRATWCLAALDHVRRRIPLPH